MSELYRIDYTAEDYLTDAMVKRFIDKAVEAFVLVPVTIDYEAAIERARTYLSHHASYEEQIRQAVDAALGGNE